MRPVSILARFRTRNNAMKFQTCTFTTAATAVCWGSVASLTGIAAPAQAWVAPSVQRPSNRVSSIQGHSFSSMALKLSAVAEEKGAVPQGSSSTPPSGYTIAEGAIVSMFPGGLSAVRINDDWTDALERVSTPKEAKEMVKNVAGDLQGKNVVFPNGSVGVVVAHRPPLLFVYSDKDPLNDDSIEGGGHVKVLSSMTCISTSTAKSVVDCFGRSDEPTISASTEETLERAIFSPIPRVSDIALINNPMLTGITMVDVLAPIGRGQNMLMVGHDLGEMRGFAMDFVKTQLLTGENTKCIYAAADDCDDVLERLRAAGIEDQVHVVVPTNTTNVKADVSKAAEAVAIAGSACAIGEAYALKKGMNAVVVIDTIDLHKKLWDVTTRVLVDVFGIDAVVKGDRDGGASSEMRAFYSSLIQRAGQFKKKMGGGSVTLLLLTTIPRAHSDEDAVFSESDFEKSSDKIRERIKLLVEKKIPITAATLQKIQIPIPSASEGQRRLVLQHMDELISMSDGQIWLDERLEALGQRPPMDPQRSLTRIGIGHDTDSRADAPALRRIVEGLRLALSQSANMDGAEANTASLKQIRKQNALLLAMYQTSGSGGRKLSESCVVSLAAFQGYLDETVDSGRLAGTEKGQRVVSGLLQHVRTVAPDALADVDKSLDLSVESRAVLISAIESYFASSQ